MKELTNTFQQEHRASGFYMTVLVANPRGRQSPCHIHQMPWFHGDVEPDNRAISKRLKNLMTDLQTSGRPSSHAKVPRSHRRVE